MYCYLLKMVSERAPRMISFFFELRLVDMDGVRPLRRFSESGGGGVDDGGVGVAVEVAPSS